MRETANLARWRGDPFRASVSVLCFASGRLGGGNDRARRHRQGRLQHRVRLHQPRSRGCGGSACRGGPHRAIAQQLDEAIVAIGQELIEIKEKLGHGHFGGWLKSEFGMSPDTAERYMRVVRVFGNKIRTVRI